MDLIVRLFTAGLLIWFVLLAAIVIGRVLNGGIDSAGFLRSGRGDKTVAPERVVAMVTFPVILVTYVLSALHADMSVKPALPDLSDNMILLLTGGNGLYLAGKIARA